MKISVIGTGYVGLCTGVGFAIKGHNVICVDIDEKKIKMINSGKSPIYEPLLDGYLKKVLKEKRFEATKDIDYAIKKTDISFISVGTPSRPDGSIDLRYIEQASKDIGNALKNKNDYHIVVVKSTVLPGTTENVVKKNIEKFSLKKAGKDFGLAMNPEFLREGKALEDFLNPDRIVIGGFDKKSTNFIEKLYEKFDAPILKTDIKTAEMIKYASNAFLAAKISLINEIGNICKKLGIDTYEVAKGIGYDKRIGDKFLNSGIGYGGSCFPKDVKALISKAKEIGYDPKILKDVISVNEKQPFMILDILKKYLPNLKGKKIALLGLAFKPDTDDIREAPSIKIIEKLLEEKAVITAYDPKAMNNMKSIFPKIMYAENPKHALKGADACLILTEWNEFKNLTEKDFSIMKNKIIIEGRRVLDKKKVKNFEGVCW
jgi:UDPglucose 6-dehydrogenase